jgi:tripartite-type tricarboxylate transporter receptor subunit TctC
MGQVLMPALYKDLPFNPDKDLSPVGMVGQVPRVMIVSKSLGVKDLQGLIALLRDQPNKYAFGSSGIGTITRVSGELFKKLTNTEVTHVPYASEPQTLNDLIAGRLTFVVTTVSSVPPLC